MYNYPKNGKVSTLADLITLCLYNYKYAKKTGMDDLYSSVTGNTSNNLNESGYLDNMGYPGYELVYTPNIYKRRVSSNEPAKIEIPSNEEQYSPARTIKFNDIIKKNRAESKDNTIPIIYIDSKKESESSEKYYFDYKIGIGNNFIGIDPSIGFVKNISSIDVSSISGKKYGGSEEVLMSDIFLQKDIKYIWLMEARLDISTAIEPYQSGDVNITWSGLANIYFDTGDSSIISIQNEPLTLYGVKNLGTVVWPELGEEIDPSIGYDICQYDLTVLGRTNKGYEELSSNQKNMYGIKDVSTIIYYPADCKRGFKDYSYTDIYGQTTKNIISTTLHLYRKANFITKTLFYNIDMHLEVYLGGVNYNLYPTMGYGQKIGDTTTLSKQNKRLIPWQGETVYLLTYFTYNGESYFYKSGNHRNILFNDIPAYEFNLLYFYVQDLTTVNFYASLAGEAISYASVNTASIQIPLNDVNLERTLTLSVVFVDTENENIEAGKTTSIEFRQEANPNILENEHHVIVYAMSSITNPNELNSLSSTSPSIWNWTSRLRITLVDPNTAYLQDATADEIVAPPTRGASRILSNNGSTSGTGLFGGNISSINGEDLDNPGSISNVDDHDKFDINDNEDNIENELYEMTLDDILYSAESGGSDSVDDSAAYTDSSKSNFKTFYVSANTTSDNLLKFPAKYLCGTIIDSSLDISTGSSEDSGINGGNSSSGGEFKYPHDLNFDIELNAFTFSSIENSYYFNYFTVEKDPNVILLINYYDFPDALDNIKLNLVGGNIPEIKDINENGFLDIEDWNATELRVGETATNFNLLYNDLYKGYPLYIRPKFRTYKYTLNVAFLQEMNTKDNFYYIIKFKFKYLGNVRDDLQTLWKYTNLLSTDSDKLNTNRGIDPSNSDKKLSENPIYDNIIKMMEVYDGREQNEDQYDIRSYMPIDIDNKIFFPRKIDEKDITATSYTYMFICNSQDLKEYMGIPIYGIRHNEDLAYQYNEFISLPQKITISASFLILWFIKGTGEQVSRDTHQFLDCIQYSFDNENYNVVNTSNEINIELDYYNKSVTDTILALDNITIYIKNYDIPVKNDPNKNMDNTDNND